MVRRALGRIARVGLACLNLPLPFPKVIMIECTNKCNAWCIICPREKLTRAQGVMSLELFKKIIDEAVYLKVSKVQLSNFGEPLLDPLLPEKIKYAKERGLEVYLVTNGSLMNKGISRALISAGLDKIRISIYGAVESTYEFIHKGLKLSVVEENIRTLLALKKEMASGSPFLELQFLICKETSRELKEFRSKWEGVVDKVTIAGLHNFGDSRSYIPTHRYKRINTCYFPFSVIEVFWNGDIIPCAYDFNGNLKMGNICKVSISDLWNSERYREFRRLQLSKKFPVDLLCLRCHRNRAMSLSSRCLETSAVDLKTESASD